MNNRKDGVGRLLREVGTPFNQFFNDLTWDSHSSLEVWLLVGYPAPVDELYSNSSTHADWTQWIILKET